MHFQEVFHLHALCFLHPLLSNTRRHWIRWKEVQNGKAPLIWFNFILQSLTVLVDALTRLHWTSVFVPVRFNEIFLLLLDDFFPV